MLLVLAKTYYDECYILKTIKYNYLLTGTIN